MRSSPGKRQSTNRRIFSKYFKCAQHVLLYSPTSTKQYRPTGTTVPISEMIIQFRHKVSELPILSRNKQIQTYFYIHYAISYRSADLFIFGVAGIAYSHEGAVTRLSFLISSYPIIFILFFDECLYHPKISLL